jgi:hypothetical protein
MCKNKVSNLQTKVYYGKIKKIMVMAKYRKSMVKCNLPWQTQTLDLYFCKKSCKGTGTKQTL